MIETKDRGSSTPLTKSILFCLDDFPFHGTHMDHEIMKRLVERGYQVDVITSIHDYLGNKHERTEFIDGIRIQRTFSLFIPFLPYVITPFSFFVIIMAIQKNKYDKVVCMHLTHFTTSMGTLAGKAVHNKTVVGIMGPRITLGSKLLDILLFFFEKTIGRIAIKSAETVFSVSEESKQSVLRMAERDDIKIIGAGVDSEKFHPAKTLSEEVRIKITFIGRLTKSKGIHTLISSIPEVLKEYPDTKFQLVGEGPLYKKISEIIRSRNIYEKVDLMGYREDVSDILRNSDIFVLPSLSEGSPLAVFEAMSTGLPIIISEKAVPDHLIENDRNGIVIPEDDSKELVNAIITLIKDPGARLQFGTLNRKIIEEEYSWEKTTDKFEELILSKN